MKVFYSIAIAAIIAVSSSICSAATIPAQEDVMTSNFFQGANRVRGYDGEGRAIHRVSLNGSFSFPGEETIYVTFDPSAFSGFTAPVANAILTVESISGGNGADADAANPFTVSAHGVSADPLASITDDTNLGGLIAWNVFNTSSTSSGNILPADPAALTVVDSFGTVTFDVTALVNDWLAGTNGVSGYDLALTGQNHTAGGDFLHGFVNNSETPGSTFLTVTQTVPEPSTLAIGFLALVGCIAGLRTRKNKVVA